MNEEYMDIQVYSGDNEEQYVKYGDLLELIERVKIKQEEREKEIERLNENNQAMQEEIARTWKKLDEKENIIKEVREYIEGNTFSSYDRETNLYKDVIFEDEIMKILKGEE